MSNVRQYCTDPTQTGGTGEDEDPQSEQGNSSQQTESQAEGEASASASAGNRIIAVTPNSEQQADQIVCTCRAFATGTPSPSSVQ